MNTLPEHNRVSGAAAKPADVSCPADDPAPFQDSREHLSAELARIDLLIQREIWRWRQKGAPAGDEFRGLYISEDEIDAILNGIYIGSPELQRRAGEGPTAVERAFGQAIARAEEQIQSRVRTQGAPLRLQQLGQLFALTRFDVDALLVALAPEIDLRYERLYAYLQDDVTCKRPSVALILNLCAAPEERPPARRRFAADAPLLRHMLLALDHDPAQPHPPMLAHFAWPDPRIVDFLLGEGPHCALDPRLREVHEGSDRGVRIADLVLPAATQAQLAWLATQAPLGTQAPPSPALFLLSGDPGTDQREAAQALCAAWGRRLLTAHLDAILDCGSPAPLLRRIAREAYLTGAALYWHGYDAIAAGPVPEDAQPARHLAALHAAWLEYPAIHFVPVRADREPDPALLRAPHLVRVPFERPPYDLRRTLWNRALPEQERAPGLDLDGVAGQFRLTHDQIYDAACDARHRAAQRVPDGQVGASCSRGRDVPAVTSDDLFAAARARTSDQLVHLANKIEPRHGWDDLVLPGDPLAQLHELCDRMRHRPTVLGTWGFDYKLSLGKGLNALFAGPSGTGKTMAAEVIAGDLGLDLFKIDLSTIVSKYIGETEKNLERLFRAARNSNAILFFDEADALFGKRSEVRDAHDRYANVEISYLLQKMEEYDGLVILTTNLNKNIDEAFVRRMHTTIQFPYPEQEARRRIWQIAFPLQAPLAPDVDLDLLAERFRLTGGNIRNIALTAAFLAARDGHPDGGDPHDGAIGMCHLLWATRREFQKMGRLVDECEFEEARL